MNWARIKYCVFHLTILHLFTHCSLLFKEEEIYSEKWHCLLVTQMLIPEYIREVVMQRQLCNPSSLGRFLYSSWQYPPLRTTVSKYGKKKVKCTPVQALGLCTGRTAHRGSRGIALPFLGHGTRRRWGISVTPGRSLPPGKTRYQLYKRLGGPQGRSGHVRKISPPPGFDPRTVHPGSQSLFRLRYPAHSQIWVLPKKADNLSGVVTEGSERKIK